MKLRAGKGFSLEELKSGEMEKKSDVYRSDFGSITSEIKRRERDLNLKRRWLMGLPTPGYNPEQATGPEFLTNKYLPESLLREDDIFYETVTMLVGEALGAFNMETEHHNVLATTELVEITDVAKTILSQLDTLTNRGLNLLAMVLTGGSVKFEQTRQRMKAVIRESLSEVLRTRNQRQDLLEICTQLSKLVNDPQNFQENCMRPALQCHFSAAIEVLGELEKLPFETLIIIDRKLRGVRVGMPTLQPLTRGNSRANVIEKVRKLSQEMLSQIGEKGELQKPLADALAIAGLSLKQMSGRPNSFMTDFNKFPPEIKTLQDEIMKALWVLESKISLTGWKTLQLLLDPNAEIANGPSRTEIKRMLTQYLFACGDMDVIPKYFLEAIALINGSSQALPPKTFPKEVIEEEAECILSVSAQSKQIVWDLLPDLELHQDFSDAYMEELEESDDDYNDDNDDSNGSVRQSKSCNPPPKSSTLVDSDFQSESCGDFIPFDSNPPSPLTNGKSSPSLFHEPDTLNSVPNVNVNQNQLGIVGRPIISTCNSSNLCQENGSLDGDGADGHEPEHCSKMYPGSPADLVSSSFSSAREKSVSTKRCPPKNLYLSIQAACDGTSLIAYHIIGHIMEGLAKQGSVELDCDYRYYLRGGNPIQKYTKDESLYFSEEDVVQAAKELIVSLQQRKKDTITPSKVLKTRSGNSAKRQRVLYPKSIPERPAASTGGSTVDNS
ncbi:hypothetical protein HS088_TW16G00345 [Tripterygium wilfordii]|uniref:Uncharacterized protein n=2 Tax=Tripterygium wilfordii TaxID=458696 RepID=A0A7J7CIP1_TRIWF|nr:hypothetical protein HS088_TW16G00345 [Tripterygium wilfordii]